ncbi:hypothetical protein OSB04_000719 [Centaurea solstitialis]|uniref:Autophagy-related protein 18h n=1 Tax=Centaurea solstitialis TaxID=347529 RepID=A0AA38TX33_9ASTR|nr:hypothetical protein OSB04_000719 [Centaurea solstitialis]
MRRNLNNANNDKHENSNGLIPNSFRFISSCIKTVSSNVRSAGASVSGSVSGDSSDELRKDQELGTLKAYLEARVEDELVGCKRVLSTSIWVTEGLGDGMFSVLWSCFDRLELSPSTVKNVLLLGYSNGFQVLDVDDGSNFTELVSARDDPVTFLQIQPTPEKSEDHEGFKMSHPLLLVVASEETTFSGPSYNERDESSQLENSTYSPRVVRFYSLRSHSYVHVLRFRSTVYMVRCSPRIVAVGLASQIYCFDPLTLEEKYSVLTYPISQLGGQGLSGINIGYGPMAVGPRWLAYASNNPLLTNTGRLSPQNLSPSPGVSPSTSPGSGSLMARYAMESGKQLASGLINLGDYSYRTLSNSSRKAGRAVAHSAENANAGVVVIKDFVSSATVSQFRAHQSAISALCFDPSGTLLVTASIQGSNINIFRILPSSSQNESGGRNFDWNSAHVHLYKLHRGVTSAVIQDICFSNYSQWVAIVSSRGTCHIYLLSPFGGETGIQLQNSKSIGQPLSALVSVPWWFTSSFVKDQSLSPPPPAAVTLSVVSRIKSNSGWINTVSSAASGRASVPPGVIAATFHNSVRQSPEPSSGSNADILEHLLVYTPSGYVIQYELLPSIGREQGESPLRAETAFQAQDEDLRVKVKPSQWWDVCRRKDWPEREELIGVADSNPAEEHLTTMEKDLGKQQERSRWIPHAEVQMRSGRVPVWQKSKIYFYAMAAPQLSEEPTVGGEVDIETIPVHEVEVRQRDLLPVFDSSSVVRLGSTDGRVFGGGRYSAASSSINDDKFSQDSTISRGSSVAAANVEQMDPLQSYPIHASTVNNNDGVNRISGVSSAVVPSSESNVTSDAGSNPGSNRSDSSMNVVDEVPMHEEFGHEYISPKVDERADDVDGNHQMEEEDEEDNDMLGGVFSFSEEGEYNLII